MLVGPFANRGREYQSKGQPELVRTHDFADKELGKVVPTEYSIKRTIVVGSVSALIMTLLNLQSNRSGAGGIRWGKQATNMYNRC